MFDGVYAPNDDYVVLNILPQAYWIFLKETPSLMQQPVRQHRVMRYVPVLITIGR